tara:strand:+ start:6674 stop:7579 length:906 start_codon:yes stop_codon:yes gene_type:complete
MKKVLLSFALIFTINTNAQDCTELFISEYVEGPGNNNAIEIFNPTNSSIDLSSYSINRYGNGVSTSPDSWPLSGSIASGQAIVIGNGQVDSVWVSTYWSLPVDPVFLAACDYSCSGIYPTPFYFNGDDAITIEKGANIIDILGKVGEDPGSAWTDDASAGYTDANGGTWWTKRQTLVRKPSVKKGVTMNPIVFNPTLEYDSLPDATYSGLGSHSCDCIISTVNDQEEVSYVMYPNPALKGSAVSVNSKAKIESIELINVLGEKIVVNKSSVISTSNLSKGTYIITMKFNDGREENDKLIIK